MGPAVSRACALCTFFLSALTSASASGNIGLSLKSGEGGGSIGAQLAYNFNSHWQAAFGVGGAGIPYFVELGKVRTDSYSLIGKYYLKHVYLSTGYSLKHTRVREYAADTFHRASAFSHGIPLHLGYEFGNRKGFFFSASAGLLYVFRNGGERVMGPEKEAWSDARTVDTGAGLGFTLGYYFDAFGP